MAEGLRALTTLPEDLDSIPRTHMAVYNCLQLQFQGILRIPSHSHIQAKHQCYKTK